MGRILGGRDKTTEVKRKCRGLSGYGTCSYNKRLCVNRPNHPDLPLGKSFGTCTKAFCAEFAGFCCKRIKSEKKIELLEKQCFFSSGEAQCRLPKGPFQLGAPCASASRGMGASKVENRRCLWEFPKAAGFRWWLSKVQQGVILQLSFTGKYD